MVAMAGSEECCACPVYLFGGKRGVEDGVHTACERVQLAIAKATVATTPSTTRATTPTTMRLMRRRLFSDIGVKVTPACGTATAGATTFWGLGGGGGVGLWEGAGGGGTAP